VCGALTFSWRCVVLRKSPLELTAQLSSPRQAAILSTAPRPLFSTAAELLFRRFALGRRVLAQPGRGVHCFVRRLGRRQSRCSLGRDGRHRNVALQPLQPGRQQSGKRAGNASQAIQSMCIAKQRILLESAAIFSCLYLREDLADEPLRIEYRVLWILCQKANET
jgi:hypothetical protein